SVVDVLEAIQIEEQHRQFLPMTVRHGDRLCQAVIENNSVCDVRETVVLGEIRHADRQSPRGAHVVEHHDGPGNASTPVVDGGGGVLDCGFYTVTADQNAVGGEAHRLVVPPRQRHRIRADITGGGVDDAE